MKTITKLYIGIYSVFCLYLPTLILPRSLFTLKYVIGESAADMLYSCARMSEHMIVPFIGYSIVFTVFMLFFAYRLKAIGIEKAISIAAVNIILPIALLHAQSSGLFRSMYVFDPQVLYALIALAVVVVVVSLTISAAFKVSSLEKAINQ